MPEEITYHMDEHVPTAVTRGLRARGVDVVTAQESRLLAASDEEHLDQAAAEGRVIFTQDADFLRLHAKGAEPRWHRLRPPADPDWGRHPRPHVDLSSARAEGYAQSRGVPVSL